MVQWHQTVDACNLRRKKARAKYDLHTFSMPIPEQALTSLPLIETWKLLPLIETWKLGQVFK